MTKLSELESYFYRRAGWVGRIGSWAKPTYCGQCNKFRYCKRIRMNETIIILLAKAKQKRIKILVKKCPDYDSIWKFFRTKNPNSYQK